MKKVVLWFIVFIFLFTNGCIVKKTNAVNEQSRINNYIVYNLGKLPEDLLLLNSSNIREKDLLLSLFEGLVQTDSSGNIVPGIAESWTVGEDDITYDFKLRENAKWSDGSNITAENFVNFFEEILNSKNENTYAQDLYCIFGAYEYNKGNKPFGSVAVKALGDKELQIRLNAPTQNFLYILSQSVYTLRKLDERLKTWKTDYKNIIYSGPFVIGEVTQQGGIVLNKNINYYNKEEVKSDKIYITSIEGSEESLASFKNSNINVFTTPPLGETNSLIIDGESEEIPISSGSSINFNMKKSGNISDANFRKAISLCIDRNEIVQKYLYGIERSASAYIPFENSLKNIGVNNRSLFSDIADYAAAQKSLAESKYNEKEKLKFIYLNDNKNKKICEGIAKDVKDAIGVNIIASGVNEDVYESILNSGDYDLILTDYASSYNDPMSLLKNWVSTSEQNAFGFKNNEFDSLISKAKYEKDKAKRDEMLRKCEEILANDIPIVPVYFHNLILCRKSYVKGIYVTKEGNVKLDRAYIEPDN